MTAPSAADLAALLPDLATPPAAGPNRDWQCSGCAEWNGGHRTTCHQCGGLFAPVATPAATYKPCVCGCALCNSKAGHCHSAACEQWT